MRYGSLFSGQGIGDFGFEMAGFECAWQVEFDPEPNKKIKTHWRKQYNQKLLAIRYPKSKKYGDIKKVKPENLGPVELITGGFPCQPFSVAGKGLGRNDDRSIWPEMFRIIKTLKPRWVIAENVPGIISIYLDTVLADLGNEGYTFWPIVFSSHSLGAHHKRERVWIMAYRNDSNGSHLSGQSQNKRSNISNASSKSDVADTRCSPKGPKKNGFGDKQVNGKKTKEQSTSWNGSTNSGEIISNPEIEYTWRLPIGKKEEFPRPPFIYKNVSHSRGRESDGLSMQSRKQEETISPWFPPIFRNYWSIEPAVGRVAHGCANRIYRLKGLGNGQTPCSTYVIGKWILEYEKLNIRKKNG